ncbi:MAG: UDP-glucose 4-epimerase GalE [Erysipelotrichaceae bacterium]|nr:UDP-glucose 4-epimerase GalE [Erysipelotrichaceae bacterium]MDD3923620.1 UDP-glucose 4-epimerase GalE [Erysipelotrichaceae bacterium]MDD4641975.1 UDP-glucose 4-epimerase GalE [Erysipelotrichaceae bacterium]
MKVLVTGGTGFIGSHTCVELINNGHDVIIVDNLSNSSREVLNRIAKITGSIPKFYKDDLLDNEALDSIFEENKIDSVIHFAGYKAVGESVEKPLMYYQNNVIATLNLLDKMVKYNVKRLVFSSSATVYGDPDMVPIVETSRLQPTNPYGNTKLVIEDILRDVAYADHQWQIALLRYFNPIGAHSSGLIGETPNGIPNNLLPYIAQVATGKREELRVWGNDYPTIDGTGVRDYIHVVDLAVGHLKALKYIDNHPGIEAFNLGRGVGYSVLQVVQAFEKATGQKIPYQIMDRRPGDIATCFADTKKAKDLLNFEAIYDIEQMCSDLWNFYKNNPEGIKE